MDDDQRLTHSTVRLYVKGSFASIAEFVSSSYITDALKSIATINLKWRLDTVDVETRYFRHITSLSHGSEEHSQGWYYNVYELRTSGCSVGFEKLRTCLNNQVAVVKVGREQLLLMTDNRITHRLGIKPFQASDGCRLHCIHISRESSREKGEAHVHHIRNDESLSWNARTKLNHHFGDFSTVPPDSSLLTKERLSKVFQKQFDISKQMDTTSSCARTDHSYLERKLSKGDHSEKGKSTKGGKSERSETEDRSFPERKRLRSQLAAEIYYPTINKEPSKVKEKYKIPHKIVKDSILAVIKSKKSEIPRTENKKSRQSEKKRSNSKSSMSDKTSAAGKKQQKVDEVFSSMFSGFTKEIGRIPKKNRPLSEKQASATKAEDETKKSVGVETKEKKIMPQQEYDNAENSKNNSHKSDKKDKLSKHKSKHNYDKEKTKKSKDHRPNREKSKSKSNSPVLVSDIVPERVDDHLVVMESIPVGRGIQEMVRDIVQKRQSSCRRKPNEMEVLNDKEKCAIPGLGDLDELNPFQNRKKAEIVRVKRSVRVTEDDLKISLLGNLGKPWHVGMKLDFQDLVKLALFGDKISFPMTEACLQLYECVLSLHDNTLSPWNKSVTKKMVQEKNKSSYSVTLFNPDHLHRTGKSLEIMSTRNSDKKAPINNRGCFDDVTNKLMSIVQKEKSRDWAFPEEQARTKGADKVLVIPELTAADLSSDDELSDFNRNTESGVEKNKVFGVVKVNSASMQSGEKCAEVENNEADVRKVVRVDNSYEDTRGKMEAPTSRPNTPSDRKRRSTSTEGKDNERSKGRSKDLDGQSQTGHRSRRSQSRDRSRRSQSRDRRRRSQSRDSSRRSSSRSRRSDSRDRKRSESREQRPKTPTFCDKDSGKDCIGKRLEKIASSGSHGPDKMTDRTEKRHERQYHPYRKDNRPSRRHIPHWSFDLAYNDMNQLLLNMTENSFKKQNKRPAEVGSRHNSFGRRSYGNRGRFYHFRFRRSDVLRTPPREINYSSDDEEYMVYPDEIPDLKERAKQADVLEDYMGNGGDENEYSTEMLIYEKEPKDDQRVVTVKGESSAVVIPGGPKTSTFSGQDLNDSSESSEELAFLGSGRNYESSEKQTSQSSIIERKGTYTNNLVKSKLEELKSRDKKCNVTKSKDKQINLKHNDDNEEKLTKSDMSKKERETVHISMDLACNLEGDEDCVNEDGSHSKENGTRGILSSDSDICLDWTDEDVALDNKESDAFKDASGGISDSESVLTVVDECAQTPEKSFSDGNELENTLAEHYKTIDAVSDSDSTPLKSEEKTDDVKTGVLSLAKCKRDLCPAGDHNKKNKQGSIPYTFEENRSFTGVEIDECSNKDSDRYTREIINDTENSANKFQTGKVTEPEKNKRNEPKENVKQSVFRDSKQEYNLIEQRESTFTTEKMMEKNGSEMNEMHFMNIIESTELQGNKLQNNKEFDNEIDTEIDTEKRQDSEVLVEPKFNQDSYENDNNEEALETVSSMYAEGDIKSTLIENNVQHVKLVEENKEKVNSEDVENTARSFIEDVIDSCFSSHDLQHIPGKNEYSQETCQDEFVDEAGDRIMAEHDNLNPMGQKHERSGQGIATVTDASEVKESFCFQQLGVENPTQLSPMIFSEDTAAEIDLTYFGENRYIYMDENVITGKTELEITIIEKEMNARDLKKKEKFVKEYERYKIFSEDVSLCGSDGVPDLEEFDADATKEKENYSFVSAMVHNREDMVARDEYYSESEQACKGREEFTVKDGDFVIKNASFFAHSADHRKGANEFGLSENLDFHTELSVLHKGMPEEDDGIVPYDSCRPDNYDVMIKTESSTLDERAQLESDAAVDKETGVNVAEVVEVAQNCDVNKITGGLDVDDESTCSTWAYPLSETEHECQRRSKAFISQLDDEAVFHIEDTIENGTEEKSFNGHVAADIERCSSSKREAETEKPPDSKQNQGEQIEQNWQQRIENVDHNTYQPLSFSQGLHNPYTSSQAHYFQRPFIPVTPHPYNMWPAVPMWQGYPLSHGLPHSPMHIPFQESHMPMIPSGINQMSSATTFPWNPVPGYSSSPNYSTGTRLYSPTMMNYLLNGRRLSPEQPAASQNAPQSIASIMPWIISSDNMTPYIQDRNPDTYFVTRHTINKRKDDIVAQENERKTECAGPFSELDIPIHEIPLPDSSPPERSKTLKHLCTKDVNYKSRQDLKFPKTQKNTDCFSNRTDDLIGNKKKIEASSTVSEGNTYEKMVSGHEFPLPESSMTTRVKKPRTLKDMCTEVLNYFFKQDFNSMKLQHKTDSFCNRTNNMIERMKQIESASRISEDNTCDKTGCLEISTTLYSPVYDTCMSAKVPASTYVIGENEVKKEKENIKREEHPEIFTNLKTPFKKIQAPMSISPLKMHQPKSLKELCSDILEYLPISDLQLSEIQSNFNVLCGKTVNVVESSDQIESENTKFRHCSFRHTNDSDKDNVSVIMELAGEPNLEKLIEATEKTMNLSEQLSSTNHKEKSDTDSGLSIEIRKKGQPTDTEKNMLDNELKMFNFSNSDSDKADIANHLQSTVDIVSGGFEQGSQIFADGHIVENQISDSEVYKIENNCVLENENVYVDNYLSVECRKENPGKAAGKFNKTDAASDEQLTNKKGSDEESENENTHKETTTPNVINSVGYILSMLKKTKDSHEPMREKSKNFAISKFHLTKINAGITAEGISGDRKVLDNSRNQSTVDIVSGGFGPGYQIFADRQFVENQRSDSEVYKTGPNNVLENKNTEVDKCLSVEYTKENTRKAADKFFNRMDTAPHEQLTDKKSPDKGSEKARKKMKTPNVLNSVGHILSILKKTDDSPEPILREKIKKFAKIDENSVTAEEINGNKKVLENSSYNSKHEFQKGVNVGSKSELSRSETNVIEDALKLFYCELNVDKDFDTNQETACLPSESATKKVSTGVKNQNFKECRVEDENNDFSGLKSLAGKSEIFSSGDITLLSNSNDTKFAESDGSHSIKITELSSGSNSDLEMRAVTKNKYVKQPGMPDESEKSPPSNCRDNKVQQTARDNVCIVKKANCLSGSTEQGVTMAVEKAKYSHIGMPAKETLHWSLETVALGNPVMAHSEICVQKSNGIVQHILPVLGVKCNSEKEIKHGFDPNSTSIKKTAKMMHEQKDLIGSNIEENKLAVDCTDSASNNEQVEDLKNVVEEARAETFQLWKKKEKEENTMLRRNINEKIVKLNGCKTQLGDNLHKSNDSELCQKARNSVVVPKNDQSGSTKIIHDLNETDGPVPNLKRKKNQKSSEIGQRTVTQKPRNMKSHLKLKGIAKQPENIVSENAGVSKVLNKIDDAVSCFKARDINRAYETQDSKSMEINIFLTDKVAKNQDFTDKKELHVVPNYTKIKHSLQHPQDPEGVCYNIKPSAKLVTDTLFGINRAGKTVAADKGNLGNKLLKGSLKLRLKAMLQANQFNHLRHLQAEPVDKNKVAYTKAWVDQTREQMQMSQTLALCNKVNSNISKITEKDKNTHRMHRSSSEGSSLSTYSESSQLSSSESSDDRSSSRSSSRFPRYNNRYQTRTYRKHMLSSDSTTSSTEPEHKNDKQNEKLEKGMKKKNDSRILPKAYKDISSSCGSRSPSFGYIELREDNKGSVKFRSRLRCRLKRNRSNSSSGDIPATYSRRKRSTRRNRSSSSSERSTEMSKSHERKSCNLLSGDWHRKRRHVSDRSVSYSSSRGRSSSYEKHRQLNSRSCRKRSLSSSSSEQRYGSENSNGQTPSPSSSFSSRRRHESEKSFSGRKRSPSVSSGQRHRTRMSRGRESYRTRNVDYSTDTSYDRYHDYEESIVPTFQRSPAIGRNLFPVAPSYRSVSERSVDSLPGFYIDSLVCTGSDGNGRSSTKSSPVGYENLTEAMRSISMQYTEIESSQIDEQEQLACNGPRQPAKLKKVLLKPVVLKKLGTAGLKKLMHVLDGFSSERCLWTLVLLASDVIQLKDHVQKDIRTLESQRENLSVVADITSMDSYLLRELRNPDVVELFVIIEPPDEDENIRSVITYCYMNTFLHHHLTASIETELQLE